MYKNMFKNNQIDKGEIILNGKVLNFLCEHCGLLSETKDWWLKTIGNDFPINQLENIDGDIKRYIKQLKDIIDRIEFDRKSSIKTYTDSNGIIYNYVYDKNNNMTSMKNSNGYNYTCEYDKNNNLIRRHDSNEYSRTYEYDQNNNMIKMKDSNGYYETYEYDKNNNMIKIKDFHGYSCTYKYDKNNNKIRFKNSNGYYEAYEYDKNNNLIEMRVSNGYYENYKYDIKNRIKIDIEFFSKGSLQDKCSIPITYRKKDIVNSIDATTKEKPNSLTSFSLPNLSI